MNAHIHPEYWLSEQQVQSAVNAAPGLDHQLNNSREAVTVTADITVQEVAAVCDGVTTNLRKKICFELVNVSKMETLIWVKNQEGPAVCLAWPTCDLRVTYVWPLVYADADFGEDWPVTW